jgi:hypothetical protein
MKLKNMLRRIHPNSANLFHGRSPLSEINNNDLNLAHSMPPGAVRTSNARATVHGPLERLQSIDLAFDLAIAPGFKDGVPNRVNILWLGIRVSAPRMLRNPRLASRIPCAFWGKSVTMARDAAQSIGARLFALKCA